MYTCPQCGEQFELVVGGKADTVVTLTVVHDHDAGCWRAIALAKGERKSPESKDILTKNAEMKKAARLKAMQEKKDERSIAHPLPWDIPESTRKRIEELKEKQ